MTIKVGINGFGRIGRMAFRAIARDFPGIEVECGFPWSMAQGNEIVFSMDKAKKLIGFDPLFTLEDAIKSIKKWIEDGGLEQETFSDLKYGNGIESK